jgi:hypothetical protein
MRVCSTGSIAQCKNINMLIFVLPSAIIAQVSGHLVPRFLNSDVFHHLSRRLENSSSMSRIESCWLVFIPPFPLWQDMGVMRLFRGLGMDSDPRSPQCRHEAHLQGPGDNPRRVSHGSAKMPSRIGLDSVVRIVNPVVGRPGGIASNMRFIGRTSGAPFTIAGPFACPVIFTDCIFVGL